MEIRLLDEDGNAVPKGAEGEICLLGHFADGYLNMPEATAAAFIRQPDGTVLLHTGDIGVLDENSNLVYLNRKDWMVKINGQRVETQEIENLLKKIDGVTNAAVQAFDDRMGQKYLAAFYSLRLGLDENELRKTDALAKAKAVYEGIFGGVSLNSLPAAEKAADKESPGKAATAEYALPAVAPENAAAFCKANQITENALFTAAFGLLLARMDGSDEALFASIYNGRTRLETMRIMGMLVKTYPIYVSCDRGANTKDFLLGVQKRIQDLTANDLYSFAEAVVSYDMGAEAYPAALFEKMRAIRSDSYIMNGYGPTEATISCTMDAVTDPGLITIGRPASNVRAYILDEKGNVLPPLMPGELIIAGEGVGKGYIGRPDLTAEKFFTMAGRPAYHTGDLAAWTSDGRLRFHGRADNQVKLRGLRVELGEIESAINAVPGVLTSIVIMTGEENNKFLAGYYTASREIPAEELRAEIRKTLTAYMVPGVLMQLETMPLTANNKIDKKKLPKVEYTPDATEYVAPANAVEEDFCGWFAEVLNMEKVSAEGNFFELGGTSLSASIIAINAAEKGYGVVYPVFRIFASMDTAREVGGDFYDFYKPDTRTLAFLIADVSGKGIPAAMFMMTGKTVLRDCIEYTDDIGSAMAYANKRLCEGNEADMFVTAWMGLLDLDTGLVRFANAGHNPPVLIRDGQASFLEMDSDLILAIMDDAEYSSQVLPLEPQDLLLLYTDGITEAINEAKELYGEKRLLESLGGIVPEEDNICELVCRRVKDSVDAFFRRCPPGGRHHHAVPVLSRSKHMRRVS